MHIIKIRLTKALVNSNESSVKLDSVPISNILKSIINHIMHANIVFIAKLIFCFREPVLYHISIVVVLEISNIVITSPKIASSSLSSVELNSKIDSTVLIIMIITSQINTILISIWEGSILRNDPSFNMNILFVIIRKSTSKF